MIVIVFDISEKLEDFIDKKAPLNAIIFDYYFNFIPYIINRFSPLFTFIAVIFFTSQMASRTEIVAILSSGVSYRRLLYPYMLSAGVITILSLILNLFIIPSANRKQIAFEDKYINKVSTNAAYNFHRALPTGEFIFIESYKPAFGTTFQYG